MKRLMTLLLALPLVVAALAEKNPEVTANVATPGTLGDLILAQTENLADVVTLHLAGTINDVDAKLIKNDLVHLRNLDMKDLQLTVIPDEFMNDRDTLRTVVLPLVCKTIGSSAFYRCDSLRSVTLNNGLETIGDYCFGYCKNLPSVTFPLTLRAIQRGAFYYCTKLTAANLPAGLTTLGADAFYDCTQLAEITIPAGIKTIPSHCFSYAYELTELTIPEGIEEIGDAAFYQAFWKNKTTSGNKQIRLTMPSTLKVIGSNAFYGIQNLVELTLNEGLEVMNSSCFYNAALTEVTIPSTVHYATDPFYNCKSLATITCLPIVPPTNYGYNFIKSSSTSDVQATLVVPAVSLNEYKQTEGYSHYAAYETTQGDLPTAITIGRDFRLQTVADLPKMDITMVRDMNSGYNAYNGMGTLTVEGTETLSAGTLSMLFDRWLEYYNKYGMSTADYDIYGTVPGQNVNYAKAGTSLVVRAPMRADAVYVDMHLLSDHWQFVSFPFDVRVGDITIVNRDDYAQFTDDEQWAYFAIYRYDGAARAALDNANTWVRLNDDDVMQAGQGYIIQATGYQQSPGASYAYSQNPWLRFNAQNNTNKNKLFQAGDAAVSVTAHTSEMDHDANWNLVGNPYPCYVNASAFDFDGIVTIWNDYNNNYEALSTTDDVYVFSPFESFFLQSPVYQNAITMAADGRQLSRKIEQPLQARQLAARANTDRKVINLTLSNSDDCDRTRVVINPEAKAGYEIGRDASKMQSLVEGVSSFYSLQGGQPLAINERPLADGLVDLGMKLAANGSYTIAMTSDPGIEVELIDEQENRTVSLNAGESYTFTAKAGNVKGRFALRIGGTATALQSVAMPAQQAATAVFSLSGQRIDRAQKGVYIVNGKKVVVK